MGVWYKYMVGRIEAEGQQFYICPLCGASFDHVPPYSCPICEEPGEEFVLVAHGEPLRKVKDLL